MTWADCMYILMELEGKTVFINDDKKARCVSYKDAPKDIRSDIRKKTKVTLIKRLKLVFKDLDKKYLEEIDLDGKNPNKKYIDAIFENIKDCEVQLFASLLRILPRNILSDEDNEQKDVYKTLPFDYWEHIPHDQREALIRHIEILKKDDEAFQKYTFVTKENDKNQIFQSIKNRILYPKYYRLKNNLLQLIDIFSMDYRDLVKKMGKDPIVRFQEDLDNLLKKYEAIPNSLIRRYPRTAVELDSQLEAFDAPSFNDEDYAKLLSDALNQIE